ncbi:hypothetical protein FP2506_16229 [Fulvimarina pelagi HTCC2506]|uniref:Uncharacterized protein n=1 Tax=Fulvimarina pelagi HTCC2506 TaxID=314231 RepID=Q0G334_9HYPH|nr:hypothetical protein FP2506_16229 [Fulvimarina pelagi HTCC2506]
MSEGRLGCRNLKADLNRFDTMPTKIDAGKRGP